MSKPVLSETAQTALVAQPRIGLALGGGGARGLAHIAVLEVFDELGLKPSMIAGTSIGAIYGAAYASGMTAAQIRAMTEETLGDRFGMVRQLLSARSDPIGRLFRVLPRRASLLNPQAIVDLILPSRMPRTFEALQIPLKVTATDLASQTGIVIDRDDLETAIAASIAIPVLFSPVERDGMTLLDGGMVNPCPYDLLAGACDITVAIDVSGAASERAFDGSPTVMETVVQATQILQKSITRERLKHQPPDIYIDVDLDQFGALEFYKPREILAAAAPVKDQLRRRISRVVGAETLPVPQTNT
jgi:NTE family protein